jgi:ABC-type transporter Mla subunit MlaD
MRRLATSAAVLVAAATVALLGMGSSSGHHKPYDVSARFDDAAFVVPGEDVRVAGVDVGSIGSLDVTRSGRRQAVVTLQITDRRFQPFHQDATCAIRPQSLIGEKYVDCNPGTAAAPALAKITHGLGAGSYNLPVTRTSSPIDTDIVNDIYQEPIRQRFSIILNEFGTGLAARGADLNAVIHRANPALGYTDQVFQILAKQNRQLAKLASDSDQVLAPLANDKQAIAGFIANANTTSVASAERANDEAATFRLFPSFLRQLRPLVVDLGQLADQGTTLMNELHQGAAPLGQQFQNLISFAPAARQALINLGASSQQSQPALIASEPLARQLLKLGNATLPAATLLDRLTSSLDQSGGIEQLMAVLFYGTTAGNGFDAVGHYVRTESLVGSCTAFALSRVPICNANFAKGSGSAAADVAPAPSTTAAAASASSPEHAAADRVAVQAAHTATGAAPTEATLRGLLGYLIGGRR